MPSQMTPAERTLRARIAAHARWAREPDRTKATQAARNGLGAMFEAQVPPEITDPEARAKAAENLRRAYYARLSLAAAKARRQRAAAHGTRKREAA